MHIDMSSSNRIKLLCAFYSAPVEEWSIAISLSVCLCVCLSVHEHISGIAGPIFRKFFVQIPCGCGSVLLWWRLDLMTDHPPSVL